MQDIVGSVQSCCPRVYCLRDKHVYVACILFWNPTYVFLYGGPSQTVS